MSKRYIPQTPNNDFVYPNNDRFEYDEEIVHEINNNVVSGSITNLALSRNGSLLQLQYTIVYDRNGSEPFVSVNDFQQFVSVHVLAPNQDYFKPWRIIDSRAQYIGPPLTYTYTDNYSQSISVNRDASWVGLSEWPEGEYVFEFRIHGLKQSLIICDTAQLGAIPTPTPTPTAFSCTCQSYTATNDSLEATAEVEWTSCEDGLTISNIIAPGTGIGFCACIGSVSVRSGSATIADIGSCEPSTPTPTPTSTPTPTPTLQPGICVTNYAASMVPCIGGTLDEYMEGSIELSAVTPAAATFELLVGYIDGTPSGNCGNPLVYETLTVTVEAGQSSGLLTCPYAPFINSNGATICTVDFVTGDYPICCTYYFLQGSTMSGELVDVDYVDCAGNPQSLTIGWNSTPHTYYVCVQAGSMVINELAPDGEVTNTGTPCN
jgi:hypothetical protein